jgi:hypothetical protein
MYICEADTIQTGIEDEKFSYLCSARSGVSLLWHTFLNIFYVGIFLKIGRHLFAELSYVQVNSVVSDTKKSFAFKNAGL